MVVMLLLLNPAAAQVWVARRICVPIKLGTIHCVGVGVAVAVAVAVAVGVGLGATVAVAVAVGVGLGTTADAHAPVHPCVEVLVRRRGGIVVVARIGRLNARVRLCGQRANHV